jgi:hypothetical protein
MTMKHTDTIHALTTAEIARQVAPLGERHKQIGEQRASIYAAAQKNGGANEAPVIDADEKAAREHAKKLLNGAAPASLSAIEADISLDKILYREQRGIEIALKILNDKELVARAVEAVEWAEAHSAEWRQLCREITLTAIRLNAFERSLQQLLAGCPDPFAVRLPMTVITNNRSIAEISLDDLKAAALAENIINTADVKRAEHGQ